MAAEREIPTYDRRISDFRRRTGQNECIISYSKLDDVALDFSNVCEFMENSAITPIFVKKLEQIGEYILTHIKKIECDKYYNLPLFAVLRIIQSHLVVFVDTPCDLYALFQSNDLKWLPLDVIYNIGILMLDVKIIDMIQFKLNMLNNVKNTRLLVETKDDFGNLKNRHLVEYCTEVLYNYIINMETNGKKLIDCAILVPYSKINLERIKSKYNALVNFPVYNDVTIDYAVNYLISDELYGFEYFRLEEQIATLQKRKIESYINQFYPEKSNETLRKKTITYMKNNEHIKMVIRESSIKIKSRFEEKSDDNNSSIIDTEAIVYAVTSIDENGEFENALFVNVAGYGYGLQSVESVPIGIELTILNVFDYFDSWTPSFFKLLKLHRPKYDIKNQLILLLK